MKIGSAKFILGAQNLIKMKFRNSVGVIPDSISILYGKDESKN